MQMLRRKPDAHVVVFTGDEMRVMQNVTAAFIQSLSEDASKIGPEMATSLLGAFAKINKTIMGDVRRG